jgi:hypothetical protein
VRRIKAVLLDWLPRRLDPLAFYHWKQPLHNVLALWVLSHACLFPGRWLLSVTLLLTAVLLRRIAIQVRAWRRERLRVRGWCRAMVARRCRAVTSRSHTGTRTRQCATQIRRGVLGFEVEQLMPTELADDSSSDPAGQRRQQQDDSDDGLSECDGPLSVAQLRSAGAGRSHERQAYREAADRLRERLDVTKAKVRGSMAWVAGGCWGWLAGGGWWSTTTGGGLPVARANACPPAAAYAPTCNS